MHFDHKNDEFVVRLNETKHSIKFIRLMKKYFKEIFGIDSKVDYIWHLSGRTVVTQTD